MLLASAAAPAASLDLPSLSRSVLLCSLSLSLSLVYLGKWDSPLSHFISFPFYSPRISLSCSALPPSLPLSLSLSLSLCLSLCASVCFGSSELETAQASEIEKGGSGHRPAHLKLRWIFSALRIFRSTLALYTRRRTSFAYPFNFFSSDADWQQ